MYAEAAGGRIYYELSGPDSAPTVVFSGSLGADHRMWAPQVDALSSQYRVLVYDTRGHGRTDATPGDYTIELLTDDVVALLSALGIEQYHFVGLSLGGMIGQVLGARKPPGLKTLTLSSTIGVMSEGVWEPRIRMAREDGMGAIADATITRWFRPVFLQGHAEVVADLKAMIAEVSPDGYVGCAAAIRDMDLRGRRADIEVPTLVVVGADDQSTPVGAAKALAYSIDGARLEVLEAAGHLPNIEQASAFNRVLLDFLQTGGATPDDLRAPRASAN
jgi:3-oxoadipate enol-lactonase